MTEKVLAGTLLGLALLVFLGLLIALPIMWLWNWLCPELFGLPLITFWQALGLYALGRCLLPANVQTTG